MGAAPQIVCPHCGKISSVPPARMADGAHCDGCRRALFQGKPLQLDDAGLRRQIGRNRIPVLVDFWAPGCRPCKRMAPVLAQAARQFEPWVRIAKLNTADYPQAAAPYNIRAVPTLILFERGRERGRISGAVTPARLSAWLQQYL